MSDKDIFRKARKKVDLGDCGAPCDEERGGPKKPLSSADLERQKRKHKAGFW